MTFPTNPTERDKYVMDKIANGDFEHNWCEIKSTYKDHNAIFYISADVLKVENIRVTVNAKMQQSIADILNASLPTAKAMDLRHVQAEISILPLPRQITNETPAVIDQSAKIDREVIRFYPKIDLSGKIISTTGKVWVLSNRLTSTISCNYGWHTNSQKFQGINCEHCASGISNLFVVQGKGFAHNCLHCDYSQQAIFLRGSAVVDNNLMTLTDVLSEPELAPLISEEGMLNVLRQP